MKRRDFMKSGLGALASAGALGARAAGEPVAGQEYEEGRKLTLGNHYLDWDLLMTGGSIRSVGLRNKLTGHDYALTDSKEFEITISQAKSRIEIPWWYIQRGRDNDDASPDHEAGLAAGYHHLDFPGEERWRTTLNLLMRGSDRVEGPPVFNGYAWFRQWFELPPDASGSPIVLCWEAIPRRIGTSTGSSSTASWPATGRNPVVGESPGTEHRARNAHLRGLAVRTGGKEPAGHPYLPDESASGRDAGRNPGPLYFRGPALGPIHQRGAALRSRFGFQAAPLVTGRDDRAAEVCLRTSQPGTGTGTHRAL